MALATISDALTQFNANLGWHLSRPSAELALEAIRFLLVNRPQRLEDAGSTLDFEALAAQATKIETFLGATAPRSFGRGRRNAIRFTGDRLQ